MPRYSFHVTNGSNLTADTEGHELKDDSTAIMETVLAAREIVAEAVLQGELIDELTFEVVDQENRLVARVPFMSVVRNK